MLLFFFPIFLIDPSTSFHPKKKRETIVRECVLEAKHILSAFYSALHDSLRSTGPSRECEQGKMV
jgi:hypothetical protein